MAGKIVAVIAGIGVFGLLNFLTPAGIAFSLTVGFLAWLTLYLTFSKKESDRKIVVDGTTRQDLDETVKAGKKLTGEIRTASFRLMQAEMKSEIEDLCRIAESMFEMLKKDPNDIRIVKQFLTYYLEPTHKIILKYVDLATTRPMPADAIQILDRTEKSMKDIRATFLQQKEKMLANDVMDLDTEIKVFQTLSNNTTPTGTPGQDKNKSSVSSNGYK